MSARNRILARVRAAREGRERVEHPGPFQGWRTAPPGSAPVHSFETLFTASGGETHRVEDEAAAAGWLDGFATGFRSMVVGRGVPPGLVPSLPRTEARDAELGVSMARGAVAETGSLVLDARDGRRSQLLVPNHLVIVRADSVHASLAEALSALRVHLPSAIGLHSGPSKSADIGQVMVRGVHGPGRIVALIIEGRD